MEHKFRKPYSFDGDSFDKIDLDLDALTGDDMLTAEREFTAAGGFGAMMETSKGYLAILAAKAAKVPAEFINGLPAKEFSKITLAVQTFLFE